MATKFKETPLKREIRLYNVELPVILHLTADGMLLAVPGSPKKLSISWESVARHAETPMDAPSFLAGKPIEFLQHQARKAKARKEKRGA